MSIGSMKSLRKILCRELDEIAEKAELSAGDLETVHKLTDTIKNIDKICMMEESDEYSLSGDWEMEGRAWSKNYSSTRNRDKSERYSRNTTKNRLINEITSALDDAETAQEREAIQRCIEQLKKT